MIHHSVTGYLIAVSLTLSLFSPVGLAADRTVIGFVLDGPWERDLEVRRLLEDKIAKELGPARVEFPAAKRLSGNWTRASVANALDTLLDDADVDLIVTLGLLSSHEAVRHEALPKPVIAARVVGSRILDVPGRDSAAGRISGVANLSYITLGDLDLAGSIVRFQEFRRFRNVCFLTSEAFREVSPDFEPLLRQELSRAGIKRSQILFVKNSITNTIASLDRSSEAVIVTLLPQLDPDDYTTLLGALGRMRLPVFSIGGRTLVQLGALAGWGPADEADKIAARVASNIRRIVQGEQAAELPVELNVEPQLAINLETAGAFGISPRDSWQDAMLVMQTIGVENSAPSMTALTPPTDRSVDQYVRQQLSQAEVRREPARILADIRTRIFQLKEFSAFDAINPQVIGNGRVVLRGFAFQAALKEEAEGIVKTIEGVTGVENQIELLPSSRKDDEIRVNVFKAIYGHGALQSYLPPGGRGAETVGVESSSLPSGPHPILILVKNGNVALIGEVSSPSHRTAAEVQARSVTGVLSLENYLKVG